MVRSMTGFGVAERIWEQWTIRAEARSVNQAGLKLFLRLPEMLRLRENELARIVEQRVSRGHVHLTVDCTLGEDAVDLLADKEKLRSYMRLVKEAAAAEGLPVSVEAGALMSLPGVISSGRLPVQLLEALWSQVLATAQEAVDGMVGMREVEGQNLARQLGAVCADALGRVEALGAGVAGSVRHYQARLGERVRQLLEGTEATVDEGALAREVAFIAERSDVSEEIARMGSHLEQFGAALQAEGGPAGKKLEFIAQEMLREANTMVAKLPSTEQVQQAIELKLDVNRLLEQLRNVE